MLYFILYSILFVFLTFYNQSEYDDMGDYIEFQCDTCDSIFIQEDNVFWVDSENKLKISLIGIFYIRGNGWI